MQERLNAWWGEADLANSFKDVEANSRKPKPYQTALNPTITRVDPSPSVLTLVTENP